jgi:hypothetical protein
MAQDRRENDKIILDRLEKIQDDSTQFKINLALNTQATKGIETNVTAIQEHLKTLNGKVITQAASIQSLQAADVLTAAYIKKAEDDKQRASQERGGWRDWVIKGFIVIVVMLFYYLLTHAGFPDFLN